MDQAWIEKWREGDKDDIGPVVTFDEHEAIYGVHPSEDDEPRPETDGCLLVPGMDSEAQWEAQLNDSGGRQ